MTAIMLSILGFLLAAAAAFMAFSYGGTAFDATIDESASSALISNGSAVVSAANLHYSEKGFFPSDLNDVTLRGIFLPTRPKIDGLGSSQMIQNDRYEVSGVHPNVCYDVNTALAQESDLTTSGARPGYMGCNVTDNVFYANF